FLSSSPLPHDLPSFPTRRSSDLQSTCGENEFTQRLRILRLLIEKKTTGEIITDYLAKNYQEILVMRWDYSVEEKYAQIYQSNRRSEEHTSELQSRENLVCRLLLE